jgi:hypothetical protein
MTASHLDQMETLMRTKTNLILDTAIFIALLAALEPGLTGITVHEWFSAAFAGVIVAHIQLHWKWITGVLGRFFARLWQTSRLQFVVDVLLFTSFTAVMMSGLMISRSLLPTLGLSAVRDPGFRMLHSLAANATLLLVGVHFALNWSWVVSAVRRYVVNPLRGIAFKKEQPVAALVETRQDGSF